MNAIIQIDVLKLNVCIGMVENIPSFRVNLCGSVIISFVARLLSLSVSNLVKANV